MSHYLWYLKAIFPETEPYYKNELRWSRTRAKYLPVNCKFICDSTAT